MQSYLNKLKYILNISIQMKTTNKPVYLQCTQKSVVDFALSRTSPKMPACLARAPKW